MSKTSSQSAVTASSFTPKIYRFEAPSRVSVADAQHKKFASFMERRQRNPERAAGLAKARSELADALYPEDGTTLKTLRLKAGLTQTQLAALMETSQPLVARIEAGRQDPTMSTCKKLSAALGVNLETISSALDRQAEINEHKAQK
ncbi:helix-turn-helix transcriptional regulator [Pseudomonas qingdaonensis]|uniref:helix-turn-helix transcriptional regulator n=1 Tax=Pseudomonas qingdaonensis TaxID=2056231 RepID=UPI003518F6D0